MIQIKLSEKNPEKVYLHHHRKSPILFHTMSLTATLSLPSISSFPLIQTRTPSSSCSLDCSKNLYQKSHSLQVQPVYPLLASRRASSFPKRSDDIIHDPRYWGRSIAPDEDDEDDEDEEEDRSLDLLVRFVQNMFKKISKRARKAVRSVLPISISSKLVRFYVDGVLMLGFLWILKAFLEVVCAFGSVVFVSILLIRGIWAGVTYLQESRNYKLDEFNDDHHTWSRVQPAA